MPIDYHAPVYKLLRILVFAVNIAMNNQSTRVDSGVTALVDAVARESFDAVVRLVALGADIHADNDAALRLAARQHNIDIFMYLLSHGANLCANDNEILDYASESGYTKLLYYIRTLSLALRTPA